MIGKFMVVTLYAGEPRSSRGPFDNLSQANECARELCMGECIAAVVVQVRYTMTRTVETDEPRGL